MQKCDFPVSFCGNFDVVRLVLTHLFGRKVIIAHVLVIKKYIFIHMIKIFSQALIEQVEILIMLFLLLIDRSQSSNHLKYDITLVSKVDVGVI